MARPIITMDHLRSSKKPIRKHVWICMDSEVADELREAKQALRRLEERSGLRGTAAPNAMALAQAQSTVDEAEAKVREASVKFVFKSLGRRAFTDLVGKHPPTAEQKAMATATQSVDFNPDTLPQELVALSLVEPELSEADVKEIFESDDWSDQDIIALFNTAMLANQMNSVVTLGKD